MSEEETKNPTEEGGEGSITAPQPEPIELIINKKTGEIIFKSPDGQEVRARAKVIEDDDDEDDDGYENEGENEAEETEIQPLTPEQFREALQRLYDLGLTWTATQGIKPAGKDDSI